MDQWPFFWPGHFRFIHNICTFARGSCSRSARKSCCVMLPDILLCLPFWDARDAISMCPKYLTFFFFLHSSRFSDVWFCPTLFLGSFTCCANKVGRCYSASCHGRVVSECSPSCPCVHFFICSLTLPDFLVALVCACLDVANRDCT